MGDDLSVVNAARVSFDKVSEWKEVDVKEVEHTQLQYELYHHLK